MQFEGKMVLCLADPEESLSFCWEAETYRESDDADPQEQPRGGSNGAVGVNGLWNPRRLGFSGSFMVSLSAWAAAAAVTLNTVTEQGGELYQATTAGTTGASAPPWGGTTVTDGTVVWTKRAGAYECLRAIRDRFDLFFHAGILKLYLDSDRYQFAQCINRNFAPIENAPLESGISFDASFSAAEPERYGDTLNEQTDAPVADADLWMQETAYAVDDTALMPSDSGRKYKATVAGTSSDTEPYTPWTAPAWESETAYSVGDVVRPAIATGRLYVCSRAGTSGTTPPTFPASGTVDDPDGSGVEWTESDTFSDDNVPSWASTRAYLVGDIVRPAAPNGWWYECMVAGTSGGSEPAFPTTEDATVADGTATWTAHQAAVWQYDSLSAQATATITVQYAGNAEGAPVILLTVPEAVLDVTVSNLDTGQYFTLTGATDAGTLTVDCDEGLVTLDDDDAMALFDGEFLALVNGQNRIQVAWNEPGPSDIAVKYRERWW